jgi:hypothetical protein
LAVEPHRPKTLSVLADSCLWISDHQTIQSSTVAPPTKTTC